MFNCLLRQIAYEPMTWEQVNSFHHVDVVRTGQRNWTLSISQAADLLGFSFSQSSPGFTEDGLGKRKCPVCGSCVKEHSHVDVRGSRSEWAD